MYAETWVSSNNARPISLSLPLRPSREPYRAGVEAFFDNLLPDNRQIRERIQRRFRTESIGAFDLLQEIGRDCVGALQLLPAGEPPPTIRQITAERLNAEDVAQALARTLESTFLPGGGYRLTPRYDIMSAYPVLGHGRGKLSPEKIRMAMAVSGRNRHYRWKEIAARHWLASARICGFSEMKSVVEDVVAQTPAVIQKAQGILPSGFPASIAEAILEGIKGTARRLATELVDAP